MRRSFGKLRPARVSRSASLPAPVGGWNRRDSIANMDEKDAVTLTNLFPTPSDVMVRDGYIEWATGMSGQCETILVWNGSNETTSSASKMFAAAAGNFYDITNSGDIGGLYLSLPGTAGNYASTPDSATVSITGDFDLRAHILPTSWLPATEQMIVAKWDESSFQCSYSLFLRQNGKLQCRMSDTGNGVKYSNNSTEAISVADGTPLWVRATFEADNGAGKHVFAFYTSTDGTTWTHLGGTISIGTTSVFDGTAPLEVGSQNTGTDSPFSGVIYRAQVYNGIGGTLVADCNINDAAGGGATSWVSSQTGETWTVNQSGSPQATVVNPAVVTGNSNNRWQYVNFVNSAGSVYLYAVNGTDAPWIYDGTNWTTGSAIGVTANNFVQANVFKQRLYCVEKTSFKCWYFNTSSFLGTASAVDLSGFAKLGGHLIAMSTWTLDAGAGVDDYAVFLTSKGEVLVFQGTDPSSANTWAMKGRWEIGAPIAKRRSMQSVAGDVLIISNDGVLPLAKALISSRVNPRVALTDKIQGAMQSAAQLYSDNFGWQLLFYPKGSMLILNVPVNEGSNQEQYVMNTITGSWGRFTGIEANCWAIFNDEPYFGGNGFVGKLWNVQADAGDPISWEAQQAFSYFGSRGQLKQFKEARPVFQANGSPSTAIEINTDYDTSPPTESLNFTVTTYGAWDAALWDQGIWSGDLSVVANWQGVGGLGVAASLHMTGQSQNINVRWAATDFVFEPGGIGIS